MPPSAFGVTDEYELKDRKVNNDSLYVEESFYDGGSRCSRKKAMFAGIGIIAFVFCGAIIAVLVLYLGAPAQQASTGDQATRTIGISPTAISTDSTEKHSTKKPETTVILTTTTLQRETTPLSVTSLTVKVPTQFQTYETSELNSQKTSSWLTQTTSAEITDFTSVDETTPYTVTTKSTPELTTLDQASTPTPTTLDQATTLSPTWLDQATTPSPITLDQTTKPSPATLDQSTTPSPATLDQSTTPSPTMLDHVTTPSPTTVSQTTTPSPTTLGQATMSKLTTLDQATTPSPTMLDQTTTPSPTMLDQTTTPSTTRLDQATTPSPTMLDQTMNSQTTRHSPTTLGQTSPRVGGMSTDVETTLSAMNEGTPTGISDDEPNICPNIIQGGNINWTRTIVFLKYQSSGEIFIRGGRNCTRGGPCTVPILYRDACLPTVAHFQKYRMWSVNDTTLNWEGAESHQGIYVRDDESSIPLGSPLVITSNFSVATEYVPLNKYGDNEWMFDVYMDCANTEDGWFELKGYGDTIPGNKWEQIHLQQNTCSGTPGGEVPYINDENINHIAMCGKINVFTFEDNDCIIDDFP